MAIDILLKRLLLILSLPCFHPIHLSHRCKQIRYNVVGKESKGGKENSKVSESKICVYKADPLLYSARRVVSHRYGTRSSSRIAQELQHFEKLGLTESIVPVSLATDHGSILQDTGLNTLSTVRDSILKVPSSTRLEFDTMVVRNNQIPERFTGLTDATHLVDDATATRPTGSVKVRQVTTRTLPMPDKNKTSRPLPEPWAAASGGLFGCPLPKSRLHETHGRSEHGESQRHLSERSDDSHVSPKAQSLGKGRGGLFGNPGLSGDVSSNLAATGPNKYLLGRGGCIQGHHPNSSGPKAPYSLSNDHNFVNTYSNAQKEEFNESGRVIIYRGVDQMLVGQAESDTHSQSTITEMPRTFVYPKVPASVPRSTRRIPQHPRSTTACPNLRYHSSASIPTPVSSIQSSNLSTRSGSSLQAASLDGGYNHYDPNGLIQGLRCMTQQIQIYARALSDPHQFLQQVHQKGETIMA